MSCARASLAFEKKSGEPVARGWKFFPAQKQPTPSSISSNFCLVGGPCDGPLRRTTLPSRSFSLREESVRGLEARFVVSILERPLVAVGVAKTQRVQFVLPSIFEPASPSQCFPPGERDGECGRLGLLEVQEPLGAYARRGSTCSGLAGLARGRRRSPASV